MKSAIVIYLFLCFYLLGGTDAASSGFCGQKICFSPEKVSDNAQLLAAITPNYDVVIDNLGTGEERNQFLGIEDDDEDETEMFVRKNFQLDKQISSFLYALLSNRHHYSSPKALSFFNDQLYTCSGLYIQLRTLRI